MTPRARREIAVGLTFGIATEAEAAEIATLRNAVAERLTAEHGRGHWSSGVSENGVRRAIRTSRVLVGREGDGIVATLRLATQKPWAIDVDCFTPARRPLYLLDMAVAPDRQRQGLGRQLLAQGIAAARAWSSDALRLDAYDAPAGAGAFYARCGWRETGRVTYRRTPLIYFEYLVP